MNINFLNNSSVVEALGIHITHPFTAEYANTMQVFDKSVNMAANLKLIVMVNVAFCIPMQIQCMHYKDNGRT